MQSKPSKFWQVVLFIMCGALGFSVSTSISRDVLIIVPMTVLCGWIGTRIVVAMHKPVWMSNKPKGSVRLAIFFGLIGFVFAILVLTGTIVVTLPIDLTGIGIAADALAASSIIVLPLVFGIIGYNIPIWKWKISGGKLTSE